MDLNGKIAVVTGGASGLGQATAETLAKAGAKVAHVDINGEAAAAAAEKTGGIGVACDVSSAESAEAAFAEIRDKLGAVSVLVNCAGIGTPGKVLGKQGPLNLDAFSQVINVNLVGSFNMLRVAASIMSQQEAEDDGERGVIINTASIAAYDGQIGQGAYAASKGGVVGMTLPTARELARYGIRVMTIAPGIFLTPMLMGLGEEVREALAANVPFPKRLGNPEEFGKLAQHICENTMLNGEVIRCDGALRMQPI